MIVLMHSDSIRFSTAVRAVADEARRVGLVVPGFRSPPRVPGADRTLRANGGAPVVAVRIRGRPFADVVADVIEGVLVVNRIPRGPDLVLRRRLVAAVEATLRQVA